MPDRPTPPRRRLDVTLHVSADSLTALAVHLLRLGGEMAEAAAAADLGDLPESQDRYAVTDGATSHLVATVAEDVTAETYDRALREWAHETLLTHPRADHRAAALDPLEPF